jgi:hypothetical protein
MLSTETLTRIAITDRGFIAAHRRWSRSDVINYVTNLVTDADDRKDTISDVLAPGLTGLRVGYHERIEMSEMESLVDAIRGAGYFKDAMRDGALMPEDLQLWNDDGSIYLPAHRKASREELRFVNHIAYGSGFATTDAAIGCTHPAWTETRWKTPYDAMLTQIGLSARMSYPEPDAEQLRIASEFWKSVL